MAPELSTLGIVHTAISLVAVGAGIWAFVRYKEISPGTRAGMLYIVMTVLTCLTGFFIFARGGFGKAHALGVLTLLVIAFAAFVRRTHWLGHRARVVEALAYSLTFFFHMIPALTETGTRLPRGAPLFDSPEDPVLTMTVGVFFIVFVIGAIAQVRHLRALDAATPPVPRRMPAR